MLHMNTSIYVLSLFSASPLIEAPRSRRVICLNRLDEGGKLIKTLNVISDSGLSFTTLY